MNERKKEWINEWTTERKKKRQKEKKRMNEWMNEQMNERTNERWVRGIAKHMWGLSERLTPIIWDNDLTNREIFDVGPFEGPYVPSLKDPDILS